MQGIDYVLLNCERMEKGTNRKIYSYRCLHCNHIFQNHKNAVNHVKQCIRGENQPKQRTLEESFGLPKPNRSPRGTNDSQDPLLIKDLDPITEQIIQLFCQSNTPFSQIDNDYWHQFIHFLNPDVDIPCRQTLMKALEEYPEVLKLKCLEDFKGQIAGLAADGATYRGKHYYAFILIGLRKVRLLQIVHVVSQDAPSLAKVFEDIYTTCKNHQIQISSIVTDNAPSLKAALTKDNPLYLRALIGDAFFWISCAAHTSQLALKDFINNNPELDAEVKRILSFGDWIRSNYGPHESVHLKAIPKMVETRWNTFAIVLNAILQQKDGIESFIVSKNEELVTKARKRGDVPKISPVDSIPDYWNEIRDAFSVVQKFTTAIEGDLVYQWALWIEYCKALDAFESMSTNIYAKALKSFFQNRFHANMEFAHLAYILTPEGLDAFRKAFPIDSEDYLFQKSTLKTTFLTIASNAFSQEEIAQYCLPGLFDYYIQEIEYSKGENMYQFFKELSIKKVTILGLNSGNPVSWNAFAIICSILLMMPCSEAVCERAFSKMKSILTDLNQNLSMEHFIAIASVKISVAFAKKYKTSV